METAPPSNAQVSISSVEAALLLEQRLNDAVEGRTKLEVRSLARGDVR